MAYINSWATLLFTLNTLGVIIVLQHNMVQSTNQTSVTFELKKKNHMLKYIPRFLRISFYLTIINFDCFEGLVTILHKNPSQIVPHVIKYNSLKN